MTDVKTIHLFVVEDDDDDFFLLKSMIDENRDLNITVDRVSTYSEAVAGVGRKPYDAALIDYYLGADTGVDLIKEIRQKSIDIPFILLTGRSDQEIETEAILADADYLEKGRFDFALLRRSLRYTLNRQAMQKERDKALSSLQQSQKMDAIGRLAGGVAHDFNNILTAIFAYVDMLLADLEPGSPFAKNVKELRKAAERAANITKQLLSFTRKQASAIAILNINDLVNRFENMLRRLISEENTLVINCDARQPNFRIDASQFEQVLLNLVVNAQDALNPTGEITVSTSSSPAGDFVVLSVTDTGTGMDEETKNHMFEPFFTTKAVGKGTGLGLATVYGIVQEFSGTIEIDSEIGKGTTFKIGFPATRETSKTVLEKDLDLKKHKGTETILLVEDESNVLEALRDSLQIRGYNVLAAADGREGIEAVRKSVNRAVDLVLSDVRMPNMGGLEMVRELRVKNPALKVIYMSGYSENVFGKNGFEPDACTRYIQKPASPSVIVEQIRVFLDEK